MRPTDATFQNLVKAVLASLKEHRMIEFKVDEKIVFDRALRAVRDNFEEEAKIEADARKMVFDLEKQNPGLDRHKMFSMVKLRLAKERKFVL